MASVLRPRDERRHGKLQRLHLLRSHLLAPRCHSECVRRNERPSYDKFIDSVVPGGIVILDSTLVEREVKRDDITVCLVPATKLAEEHGLKGLANIILIGKLMEQTGFCNLDTMSKAIAKVVPARKQHLVPKNVEAIELGMNYKG